MRVTVCFGQTRVIVPCKGGATVAELVKEACARYKKATGKSPKYWVKIRQLENAIDGGILDVDDYVYDVAEDRDQLIAIFEEEDDQSSPYIGWDHLSGSGSDGHRSPLSFQHHQGLNNRFSDELSPAIRGRLKAPTGNATVIKHEKRVTDVEVVVGVEALKSSSNSNIIVRDSAVDGGQDRERSRSPVKKSSVMPHHYYGRRESGSGQEEAPPRAEQESKHRQMIRITTNSSPSQNVNVFTEGSDADISVDSGHHSIKAKYQTDHSKNFSNFVRGATRQSIMGMLSGHNEEEGEYSGTREPPDGGKQNSLDFIDYGGTFPREHYLPPPPKDASIFPRFYTDSQEIFVVIDGRPLGIKVTSYNENKVFLGLLVGSVDKGGRSEREGLLQQGDIIVEINNYILAQYSLSVAQEIFKDAMKFPELQLRIYAIEERERTVWYGNTSATTVETHNALYRHRHTPSIPVLSFVEPTPPKAGRLSAAKSLPDLNASLTEKSDQDASPAGKLPLVARMSLDTLSNNTRKIGSMLEILLKKGEQGLGFSITTRDNSVGDPGPIYIKNILPKGAAIHDGRLHAGDRLLKVDDIEMTGHTQESAVNILRCIDIGSIVNLVVSRHLHILPRKMKDDPDVDKVLSDDRNKEFFKFEIALNDTGSAGLGISLKGNQSKKTKKDLGIFIKSVFHGGAAYQDGRLNPNDQLVSVNGQSLAGMTNHEAIDTLRTSMSTVGNVRGMIQMVVARRKNTTSRDPTSPQFSSEASSEISDSLVNERHSRMYGDSQYHHQRQTSTPTLPHRSMSPFSQTFTNSGKICHNRHFSDLSCSSSIFSTSLGDDMPLYEQEEQEIVKYMEKSLPRSSNVLSSKNLQRKTFLRRHASLKTSKKDQCTVAETINRYTRSTSSPTSPQYKNIIGDLIWNAAIDNHYKPKRLSQKSGTITKTINSANWNAPRRSYSLRGLKNKDSYALNMSNPPSTMPKHARGAVISPIAKNGSRMEKSPFDSLTALEITGNSREEYSGEDSYPYNEEIPRQIDPNPMHEYGNDNDIQDCTQGDWSRSPDPEDPNSDPFSRESVFRQSISEKRKGAASRDAQSIDTFKALKNKQLSTEIAEKEPTPTVSRQSTPSTPLKWYKPASAKSNHSSSQRSPIPTPARRNLNMSNNVPATDLEPRQKESRSDVRRSHTPISFEHRSATPSVRSQSSSAPAVCPPKPKLRRQLPKLTEPPSYSNIGETPKSSKPHLEHYLSSDSDSAPLPIVRKSNSSDSLMTFGLYSNQAPVSSSLKPSKPTINRSSANKGVPYLKPPVLPYPDLKHLAACCTPVPLGSLTQREASPSYSRRRHPLTARVREKSLEPDVEVGPTLGIAKSSSLESLQTAVENYMEMQEGPFPKPQPRVLRGRVLNESFRAALDQSYDLDNLTEKPMATLREEGDSRNGTSPLAKSSDGTAARAHEKKRAGKSYKLFGMFRVGKAKRSLSSDRNLDSQSSTSSSPRIPESEVHKKLLEAKRDDDFKRHQAETERIQAKAKAMRERQQEQRRKSDDHQKSKEGITRPEGRVRAPSVPVTAMKRMNIDPKVSYLEAPSGRRSVDPTAMRNSHPSTFEWQTSKRPTSPVDYGNRTRQKKPERKSSSNKTKFTPDYSSLPRQPRLEPNARTLPHNPDRAVTNRRGHISQETSPNQTSRSGPTGSVFNNQEFYNMQKPPRSKKQLPEVKPGARTYERVSSSGHTHRQGRSEKPKVGRTLYYDDTDDSVSPSSSLTSKNPQPQPRARRVLSPKLKTPTNSTQNGYGFSTSGNGFHREDSPEPPPVMLRNPTATTTTPVYRHSVHVDSPASRKIEHDRQPNTARSCSQKQTEPPKFKWKAHVQRNDHDRSDSGDSYRTTSPTSSSTAEQNRNAVKKLLHQTRYDGKHGAENIVISSPYNL